MIGNLVIVLISWLLLKLKHKSLTILTGTSFLYRLLQFVAGFVGSALLAVMVSGIFAITAGFTWQPAAGLGVVFLLKGFYSAFNSVLFEELFFRGVLLYFAMSWWGEKRAVLLSAFAFGIYHWFTFSVPGNSILMLWVLLYTGLWGLLFAYAYSRTGSLALPVGLHLGWNFVDQFIFDKQGGSLFSAVINVHTRYLSTLEEMLYLRLPTIAFAVITIMLLRQYLPFYFAKANQHSLKN